MMHNNSQPYLEYLNFFAQKILWFC